MDVLKNKTVESKNYISRYSPFWYAYHTLDNKYIYQTTSYINDNISYILVDVNQETTLDYLAFKYYGRPDYFWVIADFNKIQDPFINLSERFTELKIPNIANIEFVR